MALRLRIYDLRTMKVGFDWCGIAVVIVLMSATLVGTWEIVV